MGPKKFLPFIITGIMIIIFSSIVYAQEECKVLIPALSGTYEGKCKKGLAHGYGTATGTDTYTGQFKKGLPHGKGKYEWSTGEVYEGDWKNGVRDGVGSFTFMINEKDTLLAGLWVNDKYEGPVPERPKVIRKLNINRVSFFRQGDGQQVDISFYRGGTTNTEIMELTLIGSSGNEYNMGRSVGYENIQFPFECKVTYRTWNTMHSGTIDCVLELEIPQPGYWIIKVDN